MWTVDTLALLVHRIQARYVSSVNGQSGDVTVSGAVESVNGQTGAVTLGAADVGALPDTYTAPVTSVNGQTGAVLTYASVVSVAELVAAANSAGVGVPFLFHADYSMMQSLGGIQASGGGIGRLAGANGRLDYIIFQGSTVSGVDTRAAVGRIDTSTLTVTGYKVLATASDLAAKSNALTVMEKTQTQNFAGSTSYTVTKDVTEAGYTPLGIVGFSSSADYKYFASCYLNGTTATALVRNTSSSAANNVTITFYVLYAAV